MTNGDINAERGSLTVANQEQALMDGHHEKCSARQLLKSRMACSEDQISMDTDLLGAQRASPKSQRSHRPSSSRSLGAHPSL